MTTVIIKSWCCVDAAGNVSVVMRLGARDSVRIIGRLCGLLDSDSVLGNVVVISRWCVVYSLTLCVCIR